jgi:hypothetical protein
MAPQGSPEWRQERCGKATASRIADVIARTRSGWAAARDNYAADLVVERLTNTPIEGFKSAAMLQGTQREPEARAMFELHTGLAVEPVGFVQHPTLAWSGASPDGLIGDFAVFEVKCPEPKQHIETLLGAPIGRTYTCQIQWVLEVTRRTVGYWCSYNPIFPPAMQLVIRKVHWGGDEAEELREEVPIFLAEVNVKLARLLAMYGETPVPAALRDLLEASLDAAV